MNKEKKLIFGLAINDADYPVQPIINGKRVTCPYYRRWFNMLKRCYSARYQINKPTYRGCSVCEDWLRFSNFKKWMETQDWQGKALDKDLLIDGNKIYSAETCVFIDVALNSFTTDGGNNRGDYPIGTSFHKSSGRFTAYCSNPLTKQFEYLGLFSCPDEAHRAWKKRKHELAILLADTQTDHRIARALRERYAPD